MASSGTMSYGSGYKPVSHQAPIVLTARLSKRKPEGKQRSMAEKCNRESHPGMLAFTEDKTSSHSVYPEPTYFVNVHTLEDKDFTFLGVVQTPGRTSGLNSFSGASDTNVVHAGGTMTTFNTGDKTIACNALVVWSFGVDGKGADTAYLPKGWRSFNHEHCRFAITMPWDSSSKTTHKIIGRAIRTSQPGQQLDLILAQ